MANLNSRERKTVGNHLNNKTIISISIASGDFMLTSSWVRCLGVKWADCGRCRRGKEESTEWHSVPDHWTLPMPPMTEVHPPVWHYLHAKGPSPIGHDCWTAFLVQGVWIGMRMDGFVKVFDGQMEMEEQG
jgi:hypothetical protein